jgi:hypothetical protein
VIVYGRVCEEISPAFVLGDLGRVGDFEVACCGHDADDVVALFPAVQRKDRASAERDDSDPGMSERQRWRAQYEAAKATVAAGAGAVDSVSTVGQPP